MGWTERWLRANGIDGERGRELARRARARARRYPFPVGCAHGLVEQAVDLVAPLALLGRPGRASRLDAAGFDRLFDTSSLARDRSVLDAVLDQAKGIRRHLNSADRQKLDEFSTSVRELERRIDRAAFDPRADTQTQNLYLIARLASVHHIDPRPVFARLRALRVS